MRTYKRSDHRFFDDLFGFLAAASAMGVTCELYGLGRHGGFKRDDIVTIEGKPEASNLMLQYNPLPVVQSICSDQVPDLIEMNDIPLGPRPDHPLELEHAATALATLLQAVYVHFFESTRSLVEAAHGRDPLAWPDPWNFGRVVRNAFSHRGVISINNNNAAPVFWKNVSYSARDNGRRVLFGDLWIADVIILMEELDAAA
jgi:hypothetical protein